MRGLAAAIQAFLSGLSTRLVTVMRRVGDKVVAVTEAITEVVPAVAHAGLQAADSIIGAPFRALGLLGGSQGPSEPAEVQEAADTEQDAQHQVSEATQSRQLVRAVRRLALARADGATPDADMLFSIPREIAAYVSLLEPSECRRLADLSSGDTKALLEGRIELPGVRSPAQVASTPARKPPPTVVTQDIEPTRSPMMMRAA